LEDDFEGKLGDGVEEEGLVLEESKPVLYHGQQAWCEHRA